MENSGGLAVSCWASERTASGLSDRAATLLDDICTVASNIGFDTANYGNAHSYKWSSNVRNDFYYHNLKTGKSEILMTAKAFKNGNLHIFFNQEVICKLNVEFGRLKGWIKSPKEAEEELGITPEEAVRSFKSNLQFLEDASVLRIGFKEAA